MSFIPVKEYKVAVDGGSTAEEVTEITEIESLNLKMPQVMVHAKNTDLVVSFDGKPADATLTGLKRAGKNFTVPAGAVFLISLETGQNAFSVIAEDETNTSGVFILTLGYGEDI